MNRQIFSNRKRIDDLFNKVSSFSDADKSEWSKYLCILVSGYIEESLRLLLETYAKKRASPYIQNFVSQEIQGITNCKTKKIEDILCKFNPAWKDDFGSQIAVKGRSIDEIKNSIDSIVDNRHAIAHGRNRGINYATVFNYYNNVKKAVEVLEDIIK
jgi:hypothetical protein